MTDNLILYELQNIHEALTKTKQEHTLNFRMIRSTEKFNFSEPILNTTKLGFIILSVYNSVFTVNRSNNQFFYASTVIDSEEIPMENLSSISNSNSNCNSNSNTNSMNSSKITSILNYNYKGIPLLYSTITPGAYELTDRAELIKEETEGNVMIEPDKNTMKSRMEIKQGALSFDVENSIASLLGFRKLVYKKVNIHLRKLLILWVLVLLTFIVM